MPSCYCLDGRNVATILPAALLSLLLMSSSPTPMTADAFIVVRPSSHNHPNARAVRTRAATISPLGPVARNGLSYEDVEIGTGRNVFPGDSVLCYYSGSYQKKNPLLDNSGGAGANPFFASAASALGGGGKVTFDETKPGEPIEITIGMNQVILGWYYGVCGDQSLEIPPMKIGGDRKLRIPASLAYGETGAGNGKIPPDTDLEFQIAILDAKKTRGVSDDVKSKGLAGLAGFLLFSAVFAYLVTQNIDKLF